MSGKNAKLLRKIASFQNRDVRVLKYMWKRLTRSEKFEIRTLQRKHEMIRG